MQRHRSDPVTPANNPKSGNAFSTGTSPRRCNLDLDTNRILAWTAKAPRIAGLHARPGPLRGARGDRRRWGRRLRVGASVRRNDDNGQGDKFHGRFHGGSPISAFIAYSALRQSRRVLKAIALTRVDTALAKLPPRGPPPQTDSHPYLIIDAAIFYAPAADHERRSLDRAGFRHGSFGRQ